MNFIEEFVARGFYHQATDLTGLTDLTSKQKIGAYIGFDCTANSLHVGSLMQIMILRLLQKHGHQPIVILGGGTTKIGDPSGKDQARKILNDDDIEYNMQGIKGVLSKFISFEGNKDANNALIINNDLWLKELNYLEFLRDYGCHFSVNKMLKFDSVKLRLEREQNLSFLEFNYMIFQAYDFVELNRRYKCKLQIGGSDQWGNIVNGVELNRRLNNDEIFGLTTPLITNAQGTKMGKTAQGAIWLSEELLSPYDYYQFWRNSDDRDVIKFLYLFTDLSIEQIAEYKNDPNHNINGLKKILAFETTMLCHGKAAAEQAASAAKILFEEKKFTNIAPTVELSISELGSGIAAYALLHRSGITESGGEARRLIRGNAVKMNDQLIDDENLLINADKFNLEQALYISIGKKRHIIVKLTD